MRKYEDMLEEIDLERAGYLLSTSELLEETLGGTQNKITTNIDTEFSEALTPIQRAEKQTKNPIYHLEGELSQA